MEIGKKIDKVVDWVFFGIFAFFFGVIALGDILKIDSIPVFAEDVLCLGSCIYSLGIMLMVHEYFSKWLNKKLNFKNERQRSHSIKEWSLILNLIMFLSSLLISTCWIKQFPDLFDYGGFAFLGMGIMIYTVYLERIR